MLQCALIREFDSFERTRALKLCWIESVECSELLSGYLHSAELIEIAYS